MLRFCFLLFLATSLQATTLVRYDLQGLTRNAARVVVGTCKEAEPRVIEGRTYTRLLFTLSEVVKGQAATELEVCLPGGEDRGVKTSIAGMPQFAPGEEVVLFLTEADRLGHPWPVGLGQGKFRVQRDAAAKPRVFQDTGAAQFYGAPGATLSGIPLEEFLTQVRQLVKEGGGDGSR